MSPSVPHSSTPHLLVAGEDVSAHGRETFEVKNPFSGEAVSAWPCATAEDCLAAVEACARSQPGWEAVLPGQKRAIFLRAAELVVSDKYVDLITSAMSSETAAHPGWINVNIHGSASLLKEAASQSSSMKGETIKSETPSCHLYITQRRAAGVVLAVSPWNSPVLLAFRAIAIPLVCGNAVVFKISELSPASGRIAVDILLEAGLPRDVLSFLTFDRASAPPLTSLLIAHPAIKRVNFTGSDIVGRSIAQQCGANLKQCVLELGGSAPAVVFADADLEQAARAIVSASMLHAGQICMSTERIFVDQSVAEQFVEALKKVAAPLRAGNVIESATIPSLITPGAATRVFHLLTDALAKGAVNHLAHADSPAQQGPVGTVIQPAILTGITKDMAISADEIFGPIAVLTTFSSEQEAIKLANDSEYSLMASVWTNDLQRALRVAPQVRAGSVQVNGSTIHSEPTFGNAGLGGRTGFGRFNVECFTDVRSIAFHGPEAKFPLV